MNKKVIYLILSFIAAVIFINLFTYVIYEKEQVVLTRFGKPVGKAIKDAGLYFKSPLVSVNRFDKRFIAWDGDPTQIQNINKRFVKVDAYARWQISDPLLFFKKVREEIIAQSLLDDILDSEIRNVIAVHDFNELIRSTKLNTSGEIKGTNSNNKKYGRNKILKIILENAKIKTKHLGIELLDVRFKRINYVAETQASIFTRMISERQQMAEKYLSEGKGEAQKILGEKERTLKEIQSGAYREAEEIKGRADAKATKIYASAYNQNASARDFYGFVKTMETYIETFGQNDWLVLSTKGDFFKYLQSKSGK
jgi:modulator of FtsH protease HflC